MAAPLQRSSAARLARRLLRGPAAAASRSSSAVPRPSPPPPAPTQAEWATGRPFRGTVWRQLMQRAPLGTAAAAEPQQAPSAPDGKPYQVVRLDAGGGHRRMALDLDELGMRPRDLDAVDSSSFAPKRAVLAIRSNKVSPPWPLRQEPSFTTPDIPEAEVHDSEPELHAQLLVRMENVRAVVAEDYALFFDARRPRASAKRHRPLSAGATALSVDKEDNGSRNGGGDQEEDGQGGGDRHVHGGYIRWVTSASQQSPEKPWSFILLCFEIKLSSYATQTSHIVSAAEALISVARSTDAFAMTMSELERRPASPTWGTMPFRLRMLEGILHETTSFFDHKFERQGGTTQTPTASPFAILSSEGPKMNGSVTQVLAESLIFVIEDLFCKDSAAISLLFPPAQRRLRMVVERMLEDLTEDVSLAGLHRLLPLKGALTSLENDVRETHSAIEEVLGNDDMLGLLCDGSSPQSWPEAVGDSAYYDLGATSGGHRRRTGSQAVEERQHKAKAATVDMLISYTNELQDVGGALSELRTNMEAAQEVWELGLDTTRNRIIRINLFTSIATLCLTSATVPAAFFGMNIPNGVEDHPHFFAYVVGSTALSSVAILAVFIYFFQIRPSTADRRRAQDQAALRDLLQHMDDIDDIVHAVASRDGIVKKDDFLLLCKAHPSAKNVRKRELDLVFRMLDTDHDGRLDAKEIRAALENHQQAHPHREFFSARRFWE
eukprot:SM000048S16591  [mRNA]  locus=s48:612826:617892:+ [translate_table: standard]